MFAFPSGTGHPIHFTTTLYGIMLRLQTKGSWVGELVR
ncbi:hypothetical protein ACHAXR_001271 [Thalassiosira sp. AJA248-18]